MVKVKDYSFTTWTYVGRQTSEMELDVNHNLTGIKIKFMFVFDNCAVTELISTTFPNELNATVLEVLETIPFKYVKDIQFRVADFDKNLLGTEPDDMTGEAKKAKLREWGLSAGTVLMKGYNTELGGTGVRVKVDPLGARLVKYYQDELESEEVCQLTLYEAD